MTKGLGRSFDDIVRYTSAGLDQRDPSWSRLSARPEVQRERDPDLMHGVTRL